MKRLIIVLYIEANISSQIACLLHVREAKQRAVHAMRFWSCMAGARNRRWKALTLTRTSSEDIYSRKSARNQWRAKKDAVGNKKEGENTPVCCST